MSVNDQGRLVDGLGRISLGLRFRHSFGGWLIFNGVKPFIDSRADLYGDKFLETYAAIIRPDKTVLQSTLKKYGIRWTILEPESAANTVLDAMPGWRRVYTDRFAVIHEAY